VVTICDHLGLLRFRQLKHEISRKTRSIAFDRLIQHFRFDAVQVRKIGVEHDLLAANQQNGPLNSLHRNQTRVGGHARSGNGSLLKSQSAIAGKAHDVTRLQKSLRLRFATRHVGQYPCAVFGEDVRQARREFAPDEVVTICARFVGWVDRRNWYKTRGREPQSVKSGDRPGTDPFTTTNFSPPPL
jgi:hypothetical protein